jgi:hypothetical protein
MNKKTILTKGELYEVILDDFYDGVCRLHKTFFYKGNYYMIFGENYDKGEEFDVIYDEDELSKSLTQEELESYNIV